MESLEVEAKRLFQASLASSTHSLYQRGVDAFDNFRLTSGLARQWPAPYGHIVLFVAYMSLNGKSPATIGSYIAGVSHFHRVQNWTDPTKVFVVRKLLEGSRRLSGKIDTRLPITLSILSRLTGLLNMVCNSSYESKLFKSAFSLAFFAFLRVSEFTATSKKADCSRILSVLDVSCLDHSSVQVRVRFSKTDQEGRSTLLQVCRGPDSAVCPVEGLLNFLQVRPPGNGPLFWHMDKSPLTRYQFNSVLQKSVHLAGLGEGKFSTHSFRIGAATTAAGCGFSSEEIQRMGRWKSNVYSVYIRPQALSLSTLPV